MSFLSGIGGVVGGILGDKKLKDAQKRIEALGKFEDQSFNSPFGSSFAGADGFNRFNFRGQDQVLRELLGSQGAGLLGGGLFNDQQFQQAFNNNDISGALNQSNNALSQQAGNSAFGGLGGMFNQAQGLGSGFAQATANGPVDQTGGLQANLFARGSANQQNAGNQQGLFNQFLGAQRNAAQPQQDRQFNQLQDRLFAQGRLGSTGGSENLRGLFESFGQQDLNFQNNAFGLANNQRDFMANLGTNQIGQGLNLMGQNLGQFNQNANNALNFGQFAQGLEGQGFTQMLQGLQQNQAAGMNRLQQAQGLFGQGSDIFGQQFGLGLGAFSGGQDQNRLALDTILGLRGSSNDTISARSGLAAPLAGIGQARAGLAAGAASGFFEGLEGIKLPSFLGGKT